MKNKINFTQFRMDVDAALAEVAKKHNVKLHSGSISYSETAFTLKLEAVAVTAANESQNFEDIKLKQDFDRFAFYYDLTPADRLRTFTFQGSEYILVSIAPKSRKYPIIGYNKNGKGFKFQTEVLKDLQPRTGIKRTRKPKS